jgi:hypothetical protein
MLALPRRLRAVVAGSLVRVAARVGRAGNRGARHDRGMAGGRSDDARTGDGAVRVDLGGLPTTWRVHQARWVPALWAVVAGMGAARLVAALWGDLDLSATLWATGQVVLALLALAVSGTARVRLEPEGYRVGDRVWRGRLRPWSDLREVRPANLRWGTRAELRARTGRPLTVELADMTEEQVEELRRRVGEAHVTVERRS